MAMKIWWIIANIDVWHTPTPFIHFQQELPTVDTGALNPSHMVKPRVDP
jgi:hypothetical protein